MIIIVSYDVDFLTLQFNSYHSGRVAISMSRNSVATKGLYTLVYEDREGSPLIGYFTPSGSGGCYHHNGGLRMLFDKEGGSLFDEVRSAC